MKNLLTNICIDKIGYGGIGIASLADGKKVLIKGGALPGSIVDCKIVKRKKDFVESHIVRVVRYDPAIANGEIFCAHYFIPLGKSKIHEKTVKIGCGGCKRQIIDYPHQLQMKMDIVHDSFRYIMDIVKDAERKDIVPSPSQRGYRNKIEFSFGKYLSNKENLDADWNLGFHKQGEFSKIVDIDICGLISDRANAVYEYMKKLCKESGLPTYDQKMHTGFFRHLVIRQGHHTGQLLVNLSVADKYFSLIASHRDVWSDFLRLLVSDEFLQSHVTTFVVTYNNGLADVIKGQDVRTEIVWGDGYMHDALEFIGSAEDNELVTATFRISPFSFFQTNTLGAQQLFSHAMQLVGSVSGTVLDLYCGAGSIGISFLKNGLGSRVVGIEIVEEAIVDAWHNSKINGVEDQCIFLASSAEKAFVQHPELYEKLRDLELVIVDPPRDGMHASMIDFLSTLRVEHTFTLLYISCNPVTMARDIQLLYKAGFTIKTLQPVDMFPHTHHIEMIGLLK